MNRIVSIIIALCASVAIGCTSGPALQVLKAEKPTFVSVTEAGIGLSIRATVLNDGAKITVKECSVTLKDARTGRRMASLETDGRIAIRRGASEVTVPMTVNVTGGVLGGAAMLKRIDADMGNISADLHLKVKKGVVPVKIDLKDVPLEELKEYLDYLP